MTRLTAEQQAIVTAPEAAIVVLAGPGSSKTLTLIQRIAYRIQHDHVPPTQILALVFNRAAAHELRQRLTRFIGDQAQQVRVSTFHGCALAITGKTPDAARWDQEDFYDDLLGDAIVMVSDPDTVPVWCAQLREIVCDEYQDADSLIAMFVAALANAGQPRQRTIIVAGNDDQAIYQFRGGSPEHLRVFVETFHAVGSNVILKKPIFQQNSEKHRKTHQRRADPFDFSPVLRFPCELGAFRKKRPNQLNAGENSKRYMYLLRDGLSGDMPPRC